jgi:hypothetical protein
MPSKQAEILSKQASNTTGLYSFLSDSTRESDVLCFYLTPTGNVSRVSKPMTPVTTHQAEEGNNMYILYVILPLEHARACPSGNSSMPAHARVKWKRFSLTNKESDANTYGK